MSAVDINLPKSGALDRAWIIDLQDRIERLREASDDYVILSLGVRGPNVDCRNGNAVATVRMGDDTETYEALYLPDAITGARNAILRKRRLEAERREKEKGK
jgi:hypothetical protein